MGKALSGELSSPCDMSCFVILYSLICKIEEDAVYRSDSIQKDQKEILCAKSKEIASLMKMCSTLKIP